MTVLITKIHFLMESLFTTVQRQWEKSTTTRISPFAILLSDIKASGIGLFNWFMAQEGPIRGFTGAIWTGVTTYTLAKAMEQALKEDLTGLYNLVNNKSISKFDLCSLFNKYFRGGEVVINPNNKLQIDKSLFRKRTDFSFIVPSYEQQIKEMREWVDAHPSLYSHYNVK